MSGMESDAEIDRILNRDFSSRMVIPSCVEIGGDTICLPGSYIAHVENLKTFQIRNEDVFLFGYPKTGTTWAQEMVWLIVNNLDYDGAKENILKRFPLLEYPSSFSSNTEKVDWEREAITHIDNMESPRLIKSHLPWFMLPEQIKDGSKQPKMICILRNPKDACVSYYHYMKFLHVYNGSFEDFCKLSLAGREPYGSFWKTVLSYWQQRYRPNLLLIDYAEMKESLTVVIRKVADFLGKTLTDYEVRDLVEHLSFDNMKKNPSLNHQTIRTKFDEGNNANINENSSLIRRGKVGDHKSLMTPELIEKFDAWTKKNVAGTDFNVQSLLK